MNNSESRLQKEMDLRKFVLRQRITMNALLGLLTGPQSHFIDKTSSMVVRESSNFEETSEDEQLDDVTRETLGNRIE